MRANLLLWLSCLTCLFAPVWGDDRPVNQAAVVATVNGQSITVGELDMALRPQLEGIEERVRQLRQTTLNKLIDNTLLQQAARDQGISVEDYLRSHVESVGVKPADVDRAYEQSRDQFRGILAAEAKYRIRRTLEDNARAAALNSLLQTLRQKAHVSNQLMAGMMATLDAAAQEGPSLGEASAPVTIVEFSDFECPYCRSAQPALKRIMERWRGRVRRVFKHYPLEQHAHAMAAARASVCADRQGTFWAMHDRLFTPPGRLDEASLRSAAAASGLNMEKFDACMRSDEVVEQVRKDMLVGRMVGVSGTPAFFLNRQPVDSVAALESAVERLLGGVQ